MVSEQHSRCWRSGASPRGASPLHHRADAVVESDAAPQAEQAYAKTAARTKVTKARSAAKRRFVYAGASDGDALGTPGAIFFIQLKPRAGSDPSRGPGG